MSLSPANRSPDTAPALLVGDAESTSSRRRKPFELRGWTLFAARLVLGGVLFGLWKLTYEAEVFDTTVVADPVEVADYLWEALGTHTLWSNLGATMKAVVIAFVLASAIGVFIGISLALLPRFERLVSPYIDALNAMPRIALAPIFVTAFGLTMSAKIALAFSIVLFIVLTAARSGVRSVDLDVMRMATVYGANRQQMFTKILLPVAIPSIFGGLRLGLVYSLLGVVTSELIAARDGIGQLLQQYSSLFQTDRVYGLLIILAVVASLLNTAMARLEAYLLRWQPPQGQ